MNISQLKLLIQVFTFTILTLKTSGQNPPARVVAGIPVNYSEDSVGVYTLSDPLILLNGKKVIICILAGMG